MGSEAVCANTIDVHRHDIADLRRASGLAGVDMNRLQIGGTADELTRMASRALQQKGELAPHAGSIESPLLRLEQGLEG